MTDTLTPNAPESPSPSIAPLPPVMRVICPSCSRDLMPLPNARTVCPHCGWKGQILLFNPLPITVNSAEHALAEDATCIHHPTKKATAVCAGTGDYICALCAVDLSGQTYSANYLNTAGKEKAGKAFDRYLERPDNTIITLLACSFIPYLNFIFLPFAFIWIPYAFHLYFKALKMRKANPIYARVMGRGRTIAIPILLGLFSLLWAIALITIIVMIMTHH